MPLIINADDLGIDLHRDQGIQQAWRRGAVSSVSVLVNGASTATAVSAALASGMHRICGLHLNLTEFAPLCDPSTTSLCVDDDLARASAAAWRVPGAFMRGKHGFRHAVTQGTVDLAHVRAETRAQLREFARVFQHAPTHLDGHQHVHVLPGVADVVAQEMAEAGVRRTRIPAESLADAPWVDPEGPRLAFLHTVATHAKAAREVYAQYGVSAPEHFHGLSSMGQDMTHARARDTVARWRDNPAWCEWMVHPGLRNPDGIGDDFNCSADREHELDVLCAQACGASLASYLDITSGTG